jgi:predicted ester cyclase
MSAPHLVTDFYRRIWNLGEASALSELLTADFTFCDSLGAETQDHDAFWKCVCEVRTALDQYRCDILDYIAAGSHVFAKIQFSGFHIGDFRGYRPTGLPVCWYGAAFFKLESARIQALRMWGDLQGLYALLKSNAGA